MLQLDPPLPLRTSKGDGWAHLILDYSQEHDTYWGVFLNESGQFWWVPNQEVRIVANWTLGAPRNDDITRN